MKKSQNANIKENNLMRKWAKDMNRHFTKEDVWMAKRLMKGNSALLAIRGMQIQTAIRSHYIATRMAKINNSDNIKCW